MNAQDVAITQWVRVFRLLPFASLMSVAESGDLRELRSLLLSTP